jgi:peptide/nickel transport system permease protein
MSAAAATFAHARHVLGGNRVTLFSFALFGVLVLAALLGPVLVPYDPLASSAASLAPPNAQHWFGTDALGRDVFSRVVVATRLDLGLAFAAVALVFATGTLAGVAAGFLGG